MPPNFERSYVNVSNDIFDNDDDDNVEDVYDYYHNYGYDDDVYCVGMLS